jgi:hypothetical protein
LEKKASDSCFDQWLPDWVDEPWNTVSNIGFLIGAVTCMILIAIKGSGVDGPLSTGTIEWLSGLMFLAGICSAVHHALCHRYGSYTIVLDWIPIATMIITIVCLPSTQLAAAWVAMSWVSIAWVILAFAILIEDHVFQQVSPPWGHVAWHITAAIAFTSVLTDLI